MSPLALSARLLQAQPDGRLLELAREGHEAAFEALVRRYRRPLLAYCRRIAPETAAEDVLQQALLQAWGAVRGGVEVQDARAWLYRIVRNAAISFFRSVGEPPVKLADTVAASGVEHLVEQRLEAREALAHLAALPGLQREVMLGTAVQGRSHEELAHELGVSGGSVRGLIYRARATLRAAAAALIPSPLVDWAIRSGGRSPAGTPYEAIAGGGSVGLAGALLKGGAAVTLAGGLAGAAAIVTTHSEPRSDRSPEAAVIGSAHRPGGPRHPGGRILVAATIDPPAGAIDGADSNAASGSSQVHRGRRTRAGSNPGSSAGPSTGRHSSAGEHRTRTEGTGRRWPGAGRGGETSPPDRSGGGADGNSHGTDGNFGSAGSDGSESAGGSGRTSGSEATAASAGTGSTGSASDGGSTYPTTSSGAGGSSPQRSDDASVSSSGQSSANAGSPSAPQPGSTTQPSAQTPSSGPSPGSP